MKNYNGNLVGYKMRFKKICRYETHVADFFFLYMQFRYVYLHGSLNFVNVIMLPK